MKHTVQIYNERQDCNAQPVLYPYMVSESTMPFCRKYSCCNMAGVAEITTNGLHPSPDHHMEE